MSKYTTEVRWICESKSGFTVQELQAKSVDQIINAAWQHIFDFPFDFYNNEWNEKIAKFILKYYYTREIGFETVGLWKLKLNARCNEIAGKYSKMIQAIENLVSADFMANHKYTGSDNRTDNLNSVRTDNLTHKREGESKDKYSDTPQNGLSNVENGNYLTNYRDIEMTDELKDTGTQNVANTGTQNHAYAENGYKGENILADKVAQIEFERFNVLGQIVLEFSDLFMLLW